MYQQTTDWTKIFSLKSIVMALAALVSVNVGIYYFVLSPLDDKVQQVKSNLNEMTEKYVQLQSANMSPRAESLGEEVKYLREKEKRIFEKPLRRDQIPFFVLNLEKVANKSGLKVESINVNPGSEQAEGLAAVSLDFIFKGNYEQLLNFLRSLEDLETGFLINDFSVRKNVASEGLSGRCRFMLLAST